MGSFVRYRPITVTSKLLYAFVHKALEVKAHRGSRAHPARLEVLNVRILGTWR
jgi:hypothetical protein